jgi:hypothetical protein
MIQQAASNSLICALLLICASMAGEVSDRAGELLMVFPKAPGGVQVGLSISAPHDHASIC